MYNAILDLTVDGEGVEGQPKPFQRVGLEEQIFTRDGWDDNGPMCPQFYDVELLVQVGEFPPGTKFPVAFFNGDSSVLSLMDENDVEHMFVMNLSIGRKITTAEWEASREKPIPLVGLTDADDSEDE